MNSQYVQNANMSLGKWGLTGISGAATTYSTSATTLPFSVGGKAYSKAQVSGGTTPTTDAVTGSAITLTANFGTVVLWGLNAAGTVQVIKGTTEALDSAGNFIVPPKFPGNVPETFTACAYHILKGGSTLSGTFTFGSSNWNTTGMTHTVVDISTLPNRPQTS